MTVPEWFCPVICSGLDLKELMPSKPSKKKEAPKAPVAAQFRFAELHEKLKGKSLKKGKKPVEDFEENEAINFDHDM